MESKSYKIIVRSLLKKKSYLQDSIPQSYYFFSCTFPFKSERKGTIHQNKKQLFSVSYTDNIHPQEVFVDCASHV